MTASVLASPTGRGLEQDIMAIGQDGKPPAHDPKQGVPVSADDHAAK